MKQLSTIAPGQELVISTDTDAMRSASQEQRDDAIADLFVGLADAITKHGCSVDLDDPHNIRVRKDRKTTVGKIVGRFGQNTGF